MALNVGSLRRVIPARALRDTTLAVFGAQRGAPGEVVVNLDEVVMAHNGVMGLHAAEEVHHALFEFGLESGDVA